ncbi:MAG: hypothetical protein JXR89_00035 [Deltaproteobacteria bacterium]|nr:hypothetical protein [Deltaproteobacteria bacterium]
MVPWALTGGRFRAETLRLALGLLAFILCLPGQASASTQSVESHRYLRKTGSRELAFAWRLQRHDGLELVTVLGAEKDVTRMNENLATQSWWVNDALMDTAIEVLRRDNVLHFRGVFKGEKIDRVEKIDNAPWYQALSISLRNFTDTKSDQLVFWSIRPDTLDLHRLQVSKEAEEELVVNGVSCEAVRLKIQLTGFKSAFWSCKYWLRKSDGVFLRYEGPSGPPGWPVTTVELVPPLKVMTSKKQP